MIWTALIFVLAADVNLELKAATTLSQSNIYLKDVLTTGSVKQLRDQGMSSTLVSKNLHVNKTHSVGRGQVNNLVRHALPDVEISFSGPSTTRVKRAGGSFSPEAVNEAVRAYIEERAVNEAGEVEIMRISIPRILKIPSGPVDYRVRARQQKPLIGQQSLSVDMMIGGKNFRTLVVSVKLAQEALVAVAMSDVSRGEFLNESNIAWEYRHIDRISSPLLTSEGSHDLRARTFLRAGTVLTQRHAETIPLVNRNDMVYVTVHKGPLNISLRAKAMDNGGMGDKIRIKNTDSGQIMYGTVSAPGQVTF